MRERNTASLSVLYPQPSALYTDRSHRMAAARVFNVPRLPTAIKAERSQHEKCVGTDAAEAG
jgi:hypothetical protein